MRVEGLKHAALRSCVAAAMLAGCGGSQPPIGAPGEAVQAPASAPAQAPLHRALPSSSSYHLLYRFPGYANGGFGPLASLIDVNGTLYGTTKYGGGSTNCVGGCGTVFSLDTSGNEKVLHSFTGGSDGAYPAAGLLNVSGMLYGTTERGGTNCTDGCGTVYIISASGSENVLHSFGAGSDGQNPLASLTDVNGTLYGTTLYGGEYSNGTVYSITTSGAEQVLHSFCANSDGCVPSGGLIGFNGTLYGTTPQGGGNGCSGTGCGTVYSVSASGSEKVLYRFAGGSDGQSPGGSLVNVNGTLYGTTTRGGGTGCDDYGCGTAYSLTTTGTEQVMHSFAGGRDGALPQAGLIDVNGTLYGTTVSGGGTPCSVNPWLPVHGCGTIYSVTTSGGEKVRFRFKSEYVGEPAESLVNVGSALYGTTPRTSNRKCGAHGMTCGTVFAFTL